ncbi:MAG: BamA/TamA family outer membrane protein [Candidatus Zixiibacteriota bacterium]
MKSLTNILTVALSLLIAAPLLAADYQSYDRESQKADPVLTIIADKTEWRFQYYEEANRKSLRIDVSSIEKSGPAIRSGDNLRIDEESIQLPGWILEFAEVGDIDVDFDEATGEVELTFYPKDPARSQSSFRRRMSDVISVDNEIIISNEKFVRGSVIAFFGDVIINGEVNGDVVALMGDIRVNAEAVVRGNAIAADGSVRLDKDASVYGVVKSGSGKQSSRKSRARRWKNRSSEVEFYGTPVYNRVDGLLLNLGAKYEHRDSLLPSFHGAIGYAFESEQWRYDVGLSQTILRGKIPLEIGGRAFRQLKSDDDRIIDNLENSIFALLVNEDWKDWYEAEGAYGFARTRPFRWHEIEVGYLVEEYDWFDAHPKLWSLFGSKDFRGNFSSVPHDALAVLKNDLIDKKMTSLSVRYTFNTLEDSDKLRSGWHVQGSYEFSSERWKGDFDFTRVEGKIKRLQRLSRYQALSVTAAYGYVHGDYIPLNRYFFIGGLGTMYGYRHKEFMGREYMLASAEYRFRLPRTGVSPFLHWDGGRIAADRLGSENGWKSSISAGVDIDDNFRIFISQRLDMKDKDPVIYARFTANLFN